MLRHFPIMMFGRRKEPAAFKGLMTRLFGEIFGGEPESVLVDPRGLIVVNWGRIALKYSNAGFELAVKKTGNEVLDAILKNRLEDEFKMVGEGEGVFTMKVEAEYGLYDHVTGTIQKAEHEYEELLGKIKKRKNRERK